MLRVYADLNKLTLLVQERESAKEFAQFRGVAGKLLQIILTEVLNRVYVKHPDLSPAELRHFYPAKTVRKRSSSPGARKKAAPTVRKRLK